MMQRSDHCTELCPGGHGGNLPQPSIGQSTNSIRPTLLESQCLCLSDSMSREKGRQAGRKEKRGGRGGKEMTKKEGGREGETRERKKKKVEERTTNIKTISMLVTVLNVLYISLHQQPLSMCDSILWRTPKRHKRVRKCDHSHRIGR